MNKTKKIIITGASGFLGSHLVIRLRNDERYEVHALSSRPEALEEKMGGENVEYHYKDSLHSKMMKDSIVINCAYPRNSIGTEIADGLKYTQIVFEKAVEFKATAIINISSQSVYSQKRTEMATEETPVCLESPYAVGKYATELMLESISRGSETSYTNLRMASLIGPGFNQRIVNRFAINLLNQNKIKIVRQNAKFGFLDIEDAITAIVSVIDYPNEKWRDVYNVGNALGFTVEEIYNRVSSAMNEKMNVSNPTIEVGTEEFSTAVSFERLNQDTGFIPTVDMKESIERIITNL